MSKVVLVTGSEGFTGNYMVTELLNHGYSVYGIGNRRSNRHRISYYQVDLLDKPRLNTLLKEIKPDIVIHLAAKAFIADEDTTGFYLTNVMGTRNLLESLYVSGKTPEAILLASSANIYGNQEEGMLNEQTQPSPANDYAVSKLAMEYMANTWKEKLPIIITRPFNYTGVGQSESFLLPKIIAHFRAKKNEIQLGNIQVSRDFNDVRSVVSSYRQLVESKPIGMLFNVSTGKSISLEEVIGVCQDITKHKINIIQNPDFMRNNEVKFLCGDSSLLSKTIPDLKTIDLYDTITWMLQNKI